MGTISSFEFNIKYEKPKAAHLYIGEGMFF